MNMDLTTAYNTLFTEYPDVMTVDDVSKILTVSKKKAYNLIKDGTIKPIPCGRSVRVAKIEFIRYYMQIACIS